MKNKQVKQGKIFDKNLKKYADRLGLVQAV